MEEKKYEEVGANYRFFLGWRHALVGGMLLAIYSVISLAATVYKDSPEIAWIIPLIASPVGLLLRMIDVRTRDLYRATIKAGELLEGEGGGVYTRLSNEVLLTGKTLPVRKPSHSDTIDVLGKGSFVILIITAIVLAIFAFIIKTAI